MMPQQSNQGNSKDHPIVVDEEDEGKLPITTTTNNNNGSNAIIDHLSDEEKRLNEFVERKFPEWKDDKSMLFYMSNFKKSRQININDWDTRLKFWRNVLLSIISEFYKNSILIVTIGQMKTFMSRRKKSDEGIVETTLGWQTIIQQMIHDGDLISINEFKKVYDISNNQGITSWLVDVATTWFFGRQSSLTNTGSDVAVNNTKIHEDNQYIVMKPLKEITYNFIRNAVKNHVTNVDLYFCPSELREIHFPNYDFSQLDLLLRYMHCEEAAYVIEISNSKKGVVCFEEAAIKKTFLKQGEMSSQKAAGIIHLKESMSLLKKEVKSLELKMESLIHQAKEYITKGKRDEAKWILKKKKLVSNILEKRNAALHNVFELLSSIENATTDIEVIKSLSVGAGTLKQFNTELNTIQDESLENIAEALSDYKEIKNIIDSGMEEMNKAQGLEFNEEELKKDEQIQTFRGGTKTATKDITI
ncbi:hypothetical protein NAEGRDRAFT_78255 [Naegleria gruberi]|uniref:Uncharacterized protein AM22 n=1 Tax=Naegleria gruberi TaxID=5762 RepID=D2V287_NAEGR|nr:uncharacterized protein NAEGRDRAFT_78255 [Naegleria gruberi]EFC49012.1 hypothetical protein NAEGRDRAFT_78255 [Naegleria gruberi]|eukprot:XP_002681756.1 hypothetical protein NAEGRDRAFT_78255 [Naegleria gruberi strain NEG-M]